MQPYWLKTDREICHPLTITCVDRLLSAPSIWHINAAIRFYSTYMKGDTCFGPCVRAIILSNWCVKLNFFCTVYFTVKGPLLIRIKQFGSLSLLTENVWAGWHIWPLRFISASYLAVLWGIQGWDYGKGECLGNQHCHCFPWSFKCFMYLLGLCLGQKGKCAR